MQGEKEDWQFRDESELKSTCKSYKSFHSLMVEAGNFENKQKFWKMKKDWKPLGICDI